MRKRRQYILICIILSTFLIVNTALAATMPFPELDGYWAEKEITQLAKKGIVNGFPDGYHPEDKVTRAQLAAIIIKALENERDLEALQTVKSSFADISYEYWAKASIQLASELSIIQGYSKKEFRPDEFLRRDQLAVILIRTLNLAKPGEGFELDFKDSNSIPSYALPYIKEAVKRGILKGFPDNTFKPEEAVTRAQLGVMLNNWLKVRGSNFDLYGEIVETDSGAKQIKILIGQVEDVFTLTDDCLISIDRRYVNQDALKLGQHVFIVLNKEGLVTFVKAEEAGPTNSLNIAVDSRKLAKPIDMEKVEENEVSALFNPIKPESKGKPQVSLDITRAEINAYSLQATTGADGTGQVIAIIDTGLDIAHPDLWWNANNKPKVIDYIDFTEEGKVITDKKVIINSNNEIILENRVYRLGDSIKSKSGEVKFGYMVTETILPENLLDRNDEGDIVGERIGVLLIDSKKGGEYDTVYVDLSRDQNFSDERGYKLYKYDHNYLELPKSGTFFKFVISGIDPEGQFVKFGMDMNGHGTHVAGIAAANGKIKGIAPEAKLMIIKAIDSDGFADWYSIKDAIVYAAENGANIVNLSLGQYQHPLPGGSELALIVNELTRKHGTIFTIASGNTGPGLNSLATPADAEEAIAVGAYVSPRMWETDFGWTVEKESLWYFSSLGPRKDGAWYPTVVAPGSAISTIPTWIGGEYQLLEGTSMAAPHVAGGIALLLDAAKRQEITVSPQLMKKAVELGARELPHFQPAEAGHGVFDLLGTWEMLQKIYKDSSVSSRTFNHLYEVGQSTFAREYEPAQLNLYIDGNSSLSRIINWQSDVNWLKPQITEMVLPEGGLSRTLPLKFEIPNEPGLYSTILKGDDPSTPWLDKEVLTTVIKPIELTQENKYTYVKMDSLDSAQYKRYYVKVPEGANQLRVGLEVFPDTNDKYQGRARIHLVNPQGEEIKMTDYAGYGPPGYKVQGKIEVSHDFPDAGTWEIVIYSSATLSLYDEKVSQYQINIQLDSQEEQANKEFIDQYLITVLPTDVIKDEVNYVTIQIRDKENKKPLSGVVEIEGKVYQINNGKILYPILPNEENYTLNITVLE